MAEARTDLRGQIAEGVTTTVAARELAARYEVEMPITQQLYSVLFEGKSALEGLSSPPDQGAYRRIPLPRRKQLDI